VGVHFFSRFFSSLAGSREDFFFPSPLRQKRCFLLSARPEDLISPLFFFLPADGREAPLYSPLSLFRASSDSFLLSCESIEICFPAFPPEAGAAVFFLFFLFSVPLRILVEFVPLFFSGSECGPPFCFPFLPPFLHEGRHRIFFFFFSSPPLAQDDDYLFYLLFFFFPPGVARRSAAWFLPVLPPPPLSLYPIKCSDQSFFFLSASSQSGRKK